MGPSPFERAMIEATLAGEHPALAVLREQWATAKVTGRDLTGHGVYLDIEVSPEAKTLTTPRRVVLSGPWAELPGREEPVGSLLFVDDGKLAFLEMFAVDLPWPEDTSGFVFISEKELRSLKELEGVEA
jgi:hypothetical protein